MADEFKKGDEVSWNTSQGRTKGTVKKKVTSETTIEGHTAKASAENPEYVVESESGKEAVHKPGALKKEG